MRQKINELKKEIILEHAAKHFDASGYEAAQVSAIAKDAEVSIGTIYGLFESKERLFQAHIAQEMKKARTKLHEMIQTHSSEPIQVLRMMLTYYFEQVSRNKRSVQEMIISSPMFIGQFCQEQSGENPNVTMYETIAGVLKSIAQTKPMVTNDYIQLAISFRNHAAAYIERWILLDDVVLTQQVDECIELFFNGVYR